MPSTTFDQAVLYDAAILFDGVAANPTIIPVLTSPAKAAGLVTGLALGETAADAVNGNASPLSSKGLVLFAHNTDSASHLVTVTSAQDQSGRLDDITLTVAAGAIAIFGPFRLPGWIATDGNIYYFTDSNLVKFSPVLFVDP